jgi:hypothetical protein
MTAHFIASTPVRRSDTPVRFLMRQGVAVAMVATAVVCAASVAHAVSLTAVTFRENAVNNGGVSDLRPERVERHDNVVFRGANFEVIGFHTLDAEATTEGGSTPVAFVVQKSVFTGTFPIVPGGQGISSARTIYEFTIEATGPVPDGVKVPLDVAIEVGAVSSGAAFAGATVAISSGSASGGGVLELVRTCGRVGIAFLSDVCREEDVDRQNITGTRRIEALPDTLFTVTKVAFGLTLTAPGTSSFTAFADPFIQIAPDFEFRDLVRLRFSDGLCDDPFCSGAPTQVPEPGTWGLAASGAALIGALLRRRGETSRKAARLTTAG